MERELSDVMSMLPRLDYSDPVAARSEMKRSFGCRLCWDLIR
jgi:hypothetical protein